MALENELEVRHGDNKRSLVQVGQELKTNGKTLFGMVALFWVLEVFDKLIFMGGLDSLGIHPRTLSGLGGILTAPFLHGGFGHLIGNTVPFLMLGGLIMLRDRKDWMVTTALSTLVGGAGIWLLGAANSVHIGASILVFGYFGYLVSVGWFERKFGAILLSVLVALFYGGMVWGVFPVLAGAGVSWEGHLFGALGGVLSAKLLYGRKNTSTKLLTE